MKPKLILFCFEPKNSDLSGRKYPKFGAPLITGYCLGSVLKWRKEHMGDWWPYAAYSGGAKFRVKNNIPDITWLSEWE